MEKNDLTRPISPKRWRFGRVSSPAISGKSRLMKYYEPFGQILGASHCFQIETSSCVSFFHNPTSLTIRLIFQKSGKIHGTESSTPEVFSVGLTRIGVLSVLSVVDTTSLELSMSPGRFVAGGWVLLGAQKITQRHVGPLHWTRM